MNEQNQENQPNQQPKIAPAKSRTAKKPKKLLPIIVFIAGLIALCVSLVFLILHLTSSPKTADAEYLVNIGEWVEKDSASVIWNFTEIGKGTLTTNGHQNDYDFTWSLADNTLSVKTTWLYDLANEFTYTLDQENHTLTLTSSEKTITFIPAKTQNQSPSHK